MLHHLEEARVSAKKVLPEIRATLDEKFLILPVRDLAHSPDQHAVPIVLDETVPISAPDDLYDVPASAAEYRFQFLDDLPVSTYWTVEPLQVAVDHEDQVVESLSRCQRD